MWGALAAATALVGAYMRMSRLMAAGDVLTVLSLPWIVRRDGEP
jgi:hypothetical protein